MTDPSSAVHADAVERARRALAELDRLDMTALGRISLSLRDAEMRAPLREEAVRAAQAAGLGPIIDEARHAAREHVTGVFDNTPFAGIGIDLAQSRSRASLNDRVAAMFAAEDAVIAAVADPFVTDDVRDALNTPLEHLRPSWETGVPLPRQAAERNPTMLRSWVYVAFAVFVAVCVVLTALGSGIGAFGLAAAVGIALVALVVRGRPFV